MLHWAKTADGWAVNLDGSDAAERFALPRVELRATGRGWSSVCLLADGTSRQGARIAVGSLPAAKRAASELAYATCGAEYGAALRGLLAPA